MIAREHHIARSTFPALLKNCWLALMVCLASFSVSAQTGVTREVTMKAVFLFNFTQFIEWPPASFTSPGSPFVIGVVGDESFGMHMEETVEGEKVSMHPIVVHRFRDVREAKNCHILFIGGKETDKETLSLLSGRGMLTVSDAKNFMKAGGMIRFSTENNKIKLEVNPEAARQENLVISSKLLRIATIYDPK